MWTVRCAAATLLAWAIATTAMLNLILSAYYVAQGSRRGRHQGQRGHHHQQQHQQHPAYVVPGWPPGKSLRMSDYVDFDGGRSILTPGRPQVTTKNSTCAVKETGGLILEGTQPTTTVLCCRLFRAGGGGQLAGQLPLQEVRQGELGQGLQGEGGLGLPAHLRSGNHGVGGGGGDEMG